MKILLATATIAAMLLLCAVLIRFGMKLIRRLCCTHKFYSTGKDIGAGMFGFVREYEWRCHKCGKIEYTEYSDVGPLEYAD